MATTSTVKPTPIALVVCENIYQEIGGKIALVGLFSNVNVREFPIKIGRMGVFASVTGVRPGSKGKLEIVDGETETPVASAGGPFPGGENISPLTVVDMHFVFSNLEFKEAGIYYIRFWCNEHLIMMRPFTVRAAKQKDRQNEA